MQTETHDSPVKPTRRYFTGSMNEPAQWHVYVCSCGRWMKAHSAKHWTRTQWQHKACKNAMCKKRVNLNMGKVHLFDSKAEADEYIHMRQREEFLRQLEVKLFRKIQRKSQGFEDEWSEDLFDQFMIEVGFLNRELFNDIYCLPSSDLQLQFIKLYLRTKHSKGKVDDAKIRQHVEDAKATMLWGTGKTHVLCMTLIKRWCE